MRSFLLMAMLTTGIGYSALACDLCGCSASNQYLGILPQYYNQFIGMQYQYTGFVAHQPSLIDPSDKENAYEYNNTLQLWGRYYVGSRVQLFAFIPYHINNGSDAGTRINTNGIGDISVLANVAIIKDDSTYKTWHHTLLAGGGIKMPTGKYTGITTLDEEGLPNVQPGTGSWDFIANANYTVRRKTIGLNADASYTMTTANTADYKYGNRLNASLMAFYWWQKKTITLLPQAGIRYEYSLHDYDNYEKKWLNENSGGNIIFGAAGAQAYFKRIGAKLMYNVPISQHYAAGNVTVQPRVETSLLFLF